MISEASLIALKTEVERIVRPVRASRRRLDKMREELWEHLVARTEFLKEAGLSEERAVADAQVLMGDRLRLAAELQASVPIAERVLWTRWDAPRWTQRAARSLWGVDESGVAIRRRAAAFRTEVFFAALLLVVNPLMRLLVSGPRESLRVWLFGAGLCLLVLPMHAVLAG